MKKIKIAGFLLLIIITALLAACSMPVDRPDSRIGMDEQVEDQDLMEPTPEPEMLRGEDDTASSSNEETPILIQDFSSARDYLVAFLSDKYGIESTDPWVEEDISSGDDPGLAAFRYVSGPLWIEISAEAAAPFASSYTVKEVSNISNGFRWEGTLASDGKIVETMVVPPWPILTTDQARDGVLAYLSEAHQVNAPETWVDDGSYGTERITVVQSYSSGPWVVSVEFAPAAPLVPSYSVMVENASAGTRWQGEISGLGEIVEILLSE